MISGDGYCRAIVDTKTTPKYECDVWDTLCFLRPRPHHTLLYEQND